MRHRLSFVVAVFVMISAMASLGMTSGGVRVLVVAPSPQDSIAIRLRDELTVLGFDVVVVETSASTTNIARAARAAGAVAAAQVESWPPEILLWVTDDDRMTDDTLRVSQSLRGKIESEMLALRAVELLRGRLLPVPAGTAASASASVKLPKPLASSSAPPAASSSVPANTPVPPVSTPSDRKKPAPPPNAFERASALLGVGIVASPGGLSTSAHAVLQGRLPLVNRLSGVLRVSLPFVPSFVTDTRGDMDLNVLSLGVAADVRMTDLENPFVLNIGAGAGPMLLFFDGQPATPSMGRAASGMRWAAFVFGCAGIGFRVHSKIRLRLDGLMGPVFPEPVLRIAGRDVASFGRPATFVSIGVEVTP